MQVSFDAGDFTEKPRCETCLYTKILSHYYGRQTCCGGVSSHVTE